MFHQKPLTFLERVCVALSERATVDPAWEAAYAQHGGLKPYRPGFETFDQALAKRTQERNERIKRLQHEVAMQHEARPQPARVVRMVKRRAGRAARGPSRCAPTRGVPRAVSS